MALSTRAGSSRAGFIDALRAFARVLRALPERAVDHPWQTLGVALVVAVLAASLVPRVQFDADYSALLPEHSASVRELKAVRAELGGGTSDLIIEVHGPARSRLAFGRELARMLTPDPRIAWVDLDFDEEFFASRALFLIPYSDLEELARAVQTAYRESLARAMQIIDTEAEADGDSGAGAGAQARADADSGDDPWQPVRQVRRRLTERASALGLRYRPDDEDALHMFVRPRVASAELGRTRAFLDTVEATVARLDPAAHGVEVHYAGRLAIHLAEQRATSQDLRKATLLALVLVILITAAMARQLAGPVILAVPLALSLALTLAVSTFLVDHLNVISAFMMPTLVGLGIDFGIHLYFYFLAERARTPGPDSRRVAMRQAIRATAGASTSSALTTAGAFFALAVVDFRGFRELGLLGGSGVLLTFVTTYAVLPALAMLLTRAPRSPGDIRKKSDPIPPGVVGDTAYARVRALRLPCVLIVLAAVAAGAWSVPRLSRLSFENDFARLQSHADEVQRTERIESALGLILSPAVIMTHDLDAARRVEAIARAMAADAGEPTTGLERQPVAIREALSIARLVPDRAAERAVLVAELREVVGRVLAFARLDAADERALGDLERLTHAEPWTVADIPLAIQRRLASPDHTRFFVFVWPNNRLYRDSAMKQWLAVLDGLVGRARAALAAEAGGATSAIQVLDERRLPLEVLDLLGRDLPTALALASLLVFTVLVVHFRRLAPLALVTVAMAMALAVTLALLVATGIQLNVYNAVLLPCIVGIGIDNAIHILHAYRRAGPGSLGRVLRTTGIAVFLASATTAIGFGSALIARQGGLQAMGATAVIGVSCSFFASTLLVPAIICLFEKPPGRIRNHER